MKEALKEARKAYKKDEVPVGAVIVKDGEIIARAHNVKEQKKDATKHAEIIAIQNFIQAFIKAACFNAHFFVKQQSCPVLAYFLSHTEPEHFFALHLNAVIHLVMMKFLYIISIPFKPFINVRTCIIYVINIIVAT